MFQLLLFLALYQVGGGIIVVTQYIQGRIGFGSLVAVLTATMGDAAFSNIGHRTKHWSFIFVIGAIVGIISGYTIDIIHGSNYLSNPTSKIKISEKLDKTFVSKFNFIWLAIFLPGFLVGILVAFQINISEYFLISDKISITNHWLSWCNFINFYVVIKSI